MNKFCKKCCIDNNCFVTKKLPKQIKDIDVIRELSEFNRMIVRIGCPYVLELTISKKKGYLCNYSDKWNYFVGYCVNYRKEDFADKLNKILEHILKFSNVFYIFCKTDKIERKVKYWISHKTNYRFFGFEKINYVLEPKLPMDIIIY